MAFGPALGAMLGGDPFGAMLQTQNVAMQQAGDMVAGNYIKSLLPGAQPLSPMPGQPSQSMQPPQGFGGILPAIRQGVSGLFGGGGQPPGVPQGPMGGAPMAAGAPGAQPMMPPQRPPMPPQGPPGGGAGPIGSMSFDQIIQGIARANPGASPQMLLAGLNKLLPAMNAQAIQQYKMTMANIAQERAQTYAESVAQRPALEAQRQTGRTELEAQREAGRETRLGTTEAGKEKRSERAETGRQARFEQSQAHKEAMDAIKADQAYQRLNTDRQKLEQQGNYQQALIILRAQHQRAMAIIQSKAAGMKPEEVQAMQQEATQAYMQAMGRMQQRGGQVRSPPAPGTVPPAGQPAQPAAVQSGPEPPRGPVRVQTPQDAERLPVGTPYVTPDGQEYTR